MHEERKSYLLDTSDQEVIAHDLAAMRVGPQDVTGCAESVQARLKLNSLAIVFASI